MCRKQLDFFSERIRLEKNLKNLNTNYRATCPMPFSIYTFAETLSAEWPNTKAVGVGGNKNNGRVQ
jgi:hypothetical protein